MKPNVAASNARRELQGCEDQKEAARENVEHCHERVGGKPPIEPIQLIQPLRRKRILSMKSCQDLLPDGVGASCEIGRKHAPADDCAQADHDEQSDATPQGPDEGDGRQPEGGLIISHGTPAPNRPQPTDLLELK
jgi:hypothetical protein